MDDDYHRRISRYNKERRLRRAQFDFEHAQRQRLALLLLHTIVIALRTQRAREDDVVVIFFLSRGSSAYHTASHLAPLAFTHKLAAAQTWPSRGRDNLWNWAKSGLAFWVLCVLSFVWPTVVCKRGLSLICILFYFNIAASVIIMRTGIPHLLNLHLIGHSYAFIFVFLIYNVVANVILSIMCSNRSTLIIWFIL